MVARSASVAVVVAVTAAASACASPGRKQAPAAIPPAPPAPLEVAAHAAPPAHSDTKASSRHGDDSAFQSVLLNTEPELMRQLEAEGLSLFALLGAPTARSTRELAASSRFAAVSAVLRADVAELARGDRAAGVGIHRFTHRLFDVRWLESDTTRFELVAVVGRPDRAAFAADSCGETRLVYRLAYRVERDDGVIESRLPMTLSLELPALGRSGCRAWAGRFRVPAGLRGAELARHLRGPDGPLSDALLAKGFSTHRLAVNVQAVRWPSTVRPDLGGHAEYLLRSFRLEGERYVAAPLENTPDSERLSREPALKAELVAWLGEPENLEALDRGTLLLPERFLARRVISVAPRGLSRRVNRPFANVFDEQALAGLELSGLRELKSPSGVIRRLDALSCSGCHAARSLAGFHLLGADRAETLAGNALDSGVSAHLAADLPRRERTLSAALDGDPAALNAPQPFPERGAYDGFGAHCGLGTDPTFSSWTCADGFVCRPYDAPLGDPVGTCLPEVLGTAGDACEAGPLSTRANPQRDRVARLERATCAGSAVCNGNAVGFPGGMCTESCGALSDGAACGAIALLEPFNACLARGEPFASCLGAHTRPAGLRACSDALPCRDDYVCARGGASSVCIPPYFLFQLRVDGHP